MEIHCGDVAPLRGYQGDPRRRATRVSMNDRDFFQAAFAGGFLNHNLCSRASRDPLELGAVEDHLMPEIAKEFSL